ncbi:MAG: 2-oxo acid dehydrogenase subunit E2 [Chloroflexota bacterium]|nr:2-oxo acid dehydrogenase subunit E2 [Chloroflexota bacterium]
MSVPTTGRTFLLPDLGEGLADAEVVEWHVAAGDEVQVDQIVVTVETAKATVDLPCPYAGRVLTLDGAAGVVLGVGMPLLTIGANLSGAHEKSDGETKAGSGSVLIGYGTSETRRSHRRRVTPRSRPTVADTSGPVVATPVASPVTSLPVVGSPVLAARANAPKVISPVVRKLARDNGVDIAGLAPTGSGDVIRRTDVEALLRSGEAPSHEVTPAKGAAGSSGADRAGDMRIPLRGVRRAIAEKLTTSRREIPDATTWVDVDATGLMAARDEIKAVNAAAGIGLMALFARISVAGLRKFPELNARVDVEAQEIVQLADINLSFAAQSPRGLVVPVIHGAGEMTTTELAAALRELTGLARDGRLSPAQMTGGTFTLNNYGVFGTDGATPIINYPEAAMLGIGRIIDRPWAHEGQVALRKVAQLGLTFDHRVCDGGSAGGFLRFVADCVEKPASLLAQL